MNENFRKTIDDAVKEFVIERLDRHAHDRVKYAHTRFEQMRYDGFVSEFINDVKHFNIRYKEMAHFYKKSIANYERKKQ